MPRRRPSLGLRVVLGTALVAGGLAGCGADGRTPGWSGEVTSTPTARSFVLRVPSGLIGLRVSAPTDTIEDGGTTVDGGSYVVVSWREVDSYDASVDAVAGLQRYAVDESPDWAPTLAVDLGDETVEVPADTPTAIAVADDVDPSVVVTVDGEEQTLDPATGDLETGVFAPYYAAADALSGADSGAGRDAPPVDVRTTGSCSADLPRRWVPEEPERLTCEAGVLARVPYVADVGWARPGTTWVVTTASVRSLFLYFGARSGDERADHVLRGVTGIEAGLDGQPAETVLPLYPGTSVLGGEAVDARIVWAVPDDAVPDRPEVELRVRYRASGPRPADALPVVVTAAFAAEGLAW